MIDAATQQVIRRIDVGSLPVRRRGEPDDQPHLRHQLTGNTLSVIDGATNTVDPDHHRSALDPIGVAVNPMTNRVVRHEFAPRPFVRARRDDGRQIGTVSVGAGRSSVAVNPVTNRVYVANSLSGTVTAIDGATNTAWLPSTWATCRRTSRSTR